MYTELLCMRGFSEDCAKSILHRFISALIQLTKNCDFEVYIQNYYIIFIFIIVYSETISNI